MLKNKRINFLVLAMLFMALTLTACGGKSSKDKLTEASAKLLEAKSYTQDLNLSMNLESDLDDPSAAMFLSIINSTTINMNAKADLEKNLQSGNLTINFSGMEYPVEFYSSTENMMFKTPFDERFVKIDLSEVTKDMSPEDYKANAKKMNDAVMKAFLGSISDSSISEAKSSKDGVDYETITLKPTNDELIQSAKEIYTYIFKDEYLRGIMLSSSKNQMAALGEDAPSEEEIAAQLDASYDQLMLALDEAKNVVDFTGTTIAFDINPDGYVTGFDCAVVMKITEPTPELETSEDATEETAETVEPKVMTLTYNFNGTLTDIDSTVVDTAPELTEDQLMEMEELMNALLGQFLGGGMY